MDRLVDYRWGLLVALVVGLGLLAPGLSTSLEVDHSLGVWFLDDDPNLQAYEEFQDAFGNDEVVVVRAAAPDGVFEESALETMVEASEQLWDVDGVAQVHSPLSVMVASTEEGADRQPVRPTTDDIPDGEELREFAEIAGEHPLIADHLVDEGDDGFAMIVEMEATDDFDDRRPVILEDVEAVFGEVFDGRDYQRGGVGVIYQGLNDLTERDFAIFLAISYMVMFLLLWWVFRSVRMVLASLFVVAGGTVAALGAMGWLGLQVNMITVLLPTLIVVLGIADAMHFPVAYRRVVSERPDGDPRSILADSLRAAAVPCLMTTVTTMAAFLALASSSLAGVRHLGLFAAVGVGAAFVISVVVMAVALYGRGVDDIRSLPNVDALLKRPQKWVAEHPRVVGGLLVALVAVSAFGASKVSVDTYTLGFLPADHEVVTDDERLEEELGPYIPLEWTWDPADDIEIESAAMLEKIARFAQRAEADERTGQSLHLEQLYRFVGEQLFGELDDEDWESDDVAEIRAFLDELGGPEASMAQTSGFVATDENLGRITIPVEMMSASELAETIDRLQRIADEEFGESAEVRATGYLPLYATVIHHIVDTQLRSLGIAVFLILLAMLLWLRSVRLAVLSLIPNFFPVLVMLGVMGFLGINIDAVTSLVAAIVIGVAIDDTVHFLHAWKKAEDDGGDWSASFERAMTEVGPAICVTTVVLVVGFGALLFAELVTVVYFGLLTMVAAVAALIGEFLLLPLLLRVFDDAEELDVE